jgi:glycosyltransferase involved in cell wall biosynthesis
MTPATGAESIPWFGGSLNPVVDVAVLLPCRNEARTIGRVVREFRAVLPGAGIFVYDNDSSDETAAEASSAGATVRHVVTPGKGNVLRRMFSEIDASYYVVCDGDGTYDVAAALPMLRTAHDRQLDMVVGRRVETDDSGCAYRIGHRLGNRVLTGSVRQLFGAGPTDMLSGYRVLSRRYVKSFPATSSGFETETEMTIHALDLCLSFDEVPTDYTERPPDSHSKLRTVPDGIRIARFVVRLCKDYRPLLFFGLLSALSLLACGGVALCAGTGRLDHWTGSLAVTLAFAVLAVALVAAGAVADVTGRRVRELKRILFLAASNREPVADIRNATVSSAVHALEA